jgi:hypothetical protein
MPNHVTHRVTVTGLEGLIRDFIGSHIHPDGDNNPQLDFNTVVPMPAVLRDSDESTDATLGYELLIGHTMPSQRGLGFNQSILAMKWVEEYKLQTIEELEHHLRLKQPERHFDAMHAGYSALMCLLQTGYSSWYNWSIDNWGTKWGAYQYEEVERRDGVFEFVFQTAWSVPEPVFEKLAEKWPGLEIDIVSFDEGWNFAWRGRCSDGVFAGDGVEPTNEVYFEVYHEAPYEDEEGDEEQDEDPVSPPLWAGTVQGDPDKDAPTTPPIDLAARLQNAPTGLPGAPSALLLKVTSTPKLTPTGETDEDL